MVQVSPSQELVMLIERAVDHVVGVVLHADDSDGLFGGLAADLLQLHANLCETGVADPLWLARWMIRFSFDKQDIFTVDPWCRKSAWRPRDREIPERGPCAPRCRTRDTCRAPFAGATGDTRRRR